MSVYVIAEAGVNHNGDIEIAKKLVDMAKECGANAIKFQTFKAEECSSFSAKKSQYQIENTCIGESQFDMLKKLELPFERFRELKQYCSDKNIDFISTPDGIESLNFLLELDVKIIKVGSTEVTNPEFLKQIASSGKSIILSTGMSYLDEVENALNMIKSTGNEDILVMQCTTDYPTDIKDVNLKAMITMKENFDVEVGLSDHTLGFESAISAVALGAKVIEKHITLDKNMDGPDHKASMEPDDFKKYVQYIRNTELLLGDGIKKPTEREKIIMKDIRRSIVASRNLKKGSVITKEDVCYKRPGTGIKPEMVDSIIGKVITKDILEDELILWNDIL